MIGAEWSGVFPLRVDDAIAFTDCNPTIFAGGHSWALIGVLKPGNNARCLGTMAFLCFVIVRERAVERVLPWRETYRNVVAAMGRIRLVDAAIILCPVLVPRAGTIGYRIIAARFLTDPENGRYDIAFPRITLSRFGPVPSQLTGRKRDGTDIE